MTFAYLVAHQELAHTNRHLNAADLETVRNCTSPVSPLAAFTWSENFDVLHMSLISYETVLSYAACDRLFGCPMKHHNLLRHFFCRNVEISVPRLSSKTTPAVRIFVLLDFRRGLTSHPIPGNLCCWGYVWALKSTMIGVRFVACCV